MTRIAVVDFTLNGPSFGLCSLDCGKDPEIRAMTMKFDAEHLYKALSDYSERKPGRPPLFTKSQRVLFYVEIASFVLAIAFAFVGRYFPLHTKLFQWAALSFVLITQLSGLLAMIAGIWPNIRFFKSFLSRPVRTFLLPLSAKTQRDHDFAEELSTYPDDSLKFTAKRLRSEAEHVRSRLSMLFGAIDKAGAFPLFLTITATGWNLYKGFPIPFHILVSVVGALLSSYVLLAAAFLMSHRLEELAQIVDLAVDIRNAKPSEFSSEERMVQTA